MVSTGNPIRRLNVVDNRWIGLERSRIILYKSRMKTPGQALRDQFFASLEDAAQLQRVRVHEASCLLADTDTSISEVALETGFYDQAHLSRTFRRWMGMTPSEFRKEAASRE